MALHNQILQPTLVTLALWGALCVWLTRRCCCFLLPAALGSNFRLTSANDIKPYGLQRQKMANGRVEPCKPQHSWNSNHVVSNWATFQRQRQRHSDHHAHPLRWFQSLRHFKEAPQLPNGYIGTFPIAYLPPLWFYVMDKRLLAAVDRDPARLNFAPHMRDQLMARHHLISRDNVALSSKLSKGHHDK